MRFGIHHGDRAMTMLIKTLVAVAAGAGPRRGRLRPKRDGGPRPLVVPSHPERARPQAHRGPGQHKVLIELADPDHQIFTGQTVTFTVPGPAK